MNTRLSKIGTTEYLSQIRVPKELKKKVLAYAKKNNTTVSRVLRYALEVLLEQ